MRTLDIMKFIDVNILEMNYLSLSGLEGELDKYIREMGGEVYYIKLDIKFLVKFITLLRNERFDIVHSHVHYPSGFILVIAMLCGISKRIAHFRTPEGKQQNIIRLVRNVILKSLIYISATDILSVSESTMALAWSTQWFRDKRCKVVYNEIEPNFLDHQICRDTLIKDLKLPNNAVLFVNVARMHPAKNHTRIIRIFNIISSRLENAYLLLVGDNETDHAKLVRDQIALSQHSERIVMLGIRNCIPEILSACDTLVFPSLWEGLPGVVLESCSAGLSSVVSNLPGTKEIEKHIDIQIIDLVESDDYWAEMCIKMAIKSGSQREILKEQFMRSPFNLANKKSVNLLESLWIRS